MDAAENAATDADLRTPPSAPELVLRGSPWPLAGLIACHCQPGAPPLLDQSPDLRSERGRAILRSSLRTPLIPSNRRIRGRHLRWSLVALGSGHRRPLGLGLRLIEERP